MKWRFLIGRTLTIVFVVFDVAGILMAARSFPWR
jgi:hypothetical protein